jgi:SET domain-containing protein
VACRYHKVLYCFWIAVSSLPFVLSLTQKTQDRRPVLPLTSFAHQSANSAGIHVSATKGKGLGAFATTQIQTGEWVGDYEGEILTRKQVEARYWNLGKCKTADRRWIKSRERRNQGITGDYLFDMGDDVFIDGEDADVSNWCRFMNHASEKKQGCNVETKSARQIQDGKKTIQPRLWFVAMRDIANGEELSYDYGDSYWDN